MAITIAVDGRSIVTAAVTASILVATAFSAVRAGVIVTVLAVTVLSARTMFKGVTLLTVAPIVVITAIELHLFITTATK